jgi:hypothetical protein
MEKVVQCSDHFRSSTRLNQHYPVMREHHLDQPLVKASKMRRREYSGPASILPGDLVKVGQPREDLRSFLACTGDTDSARSVPPLIQSLAAPDLLAGVGREKRVKPGAVATDPGKIDIVRWPDGDLAAT